MDKPLPLWPDAPRLLPAWPRPERAYLPGHGTHPRHDPRTVPPPPLPTAPPEGHGTECPPYRYGIDLYHEGFAWEAHEAWESIWTTLAPDDPARHFLQGLIFLAAACLKVRTDRHRGARRHTRLALDRFHQTPDTCARHWGLDLPQLIQDTEAFLLALQSTPPRTPSQLPPSAPKLRLHHL